MAGIVLSASVRQNLLSLQSTADLLATTQGHLATGLKVNSALDNPTNFFTAQGLDARAGDINNLLDSISNGVQVLQAANTGITSLQKLVDSAKSVANQALQSQVGFSQKSSVTVTVNGATATNLLGSGALLTNANLKSAALVNGTTPTPGTALVTTPLAGAAGSVTGAAVKDNSAANIAAGTLLFGTAGALGTLGTTFDNGDTFTVNGHTVTISTAAAPTTATVQSGFGVVNGFPKIVTDGNGNSTVFVGNGANSTATVGDLLKAFDLASGVDSATIASGTATISSAGQTSSSINAGQVVLESSTGSDLNITSNNIADLQALGLAPSLGGAVTATRTPTAAGLGSLIQGGSTLTIDGHTIAFKDAPVPSAANVPSGSGITGNILTDGNGDSTVFLQAATVHDVLNAIDLATGVQSAANFGGNAVLTVVSSVTAPVSTIGGDGKLNISTGTSSDLTISGTGNSLAALGLSAGATGRTGQTLTIASVGGGTPTSLTFGSGPGQVQTLNDLNAQLASNNLQATINSTNGVLTISTTDEAASQTIGVIGGTATNSGNAFAAVTAGGSAPVKDPNAQLARAGLVNQFNNILSQITTTAQDSSFNGINLLNSDQLKLTFDETNKSTLKIQGVTFNAAGLGLVPLTVGTDFIDNASSNKVLGALNAASDTLRTEASTLGSNLSIVQIRQDFNKNLINVLQTGSSNLTLADTNEEAANSQALSTRQSIAVSALALANQSQQSVLQLLR
jgi:flagellin